MKKFMSIISMFMILITLTGCGKKSITCSGDLTESDITVAVKVTGDFKSDKLLTQTIIMEFDLTEYLEYSDIDTYYESFKTQYSKFDEYEGITTNVEKVNNSLIVTLKIDLTKVDDETYEELDLGSGDVDVTTKAYISEFTDMGFTCK